MKKKEYYTKSTNRKNKLHVIIWKPEGNVRAILQISHGMTEHIDRYDRMARYLTKNDILVIGNDHLGHGKTAKDKDELGYFPTKELSKTVVDDLYKVSQKIQAAYPDVPFFLMGHSMGSFMARRYMMTYGDGLDGAILMGTGSQSNIALEAAKIIDSALILLMGERFRSKLMLYLAFGSYNKRIRPLRSNNDWLSRDAERVTKYDDDPYAGFAFTLNGYRVLFDVLSYIQDKKHIQNLPKNVPVLFLSGAEDPVGHYGADIPKICQEWKRAGVKNIRMKLYNEDRHELLNELDYEQVQKDILRFLEKYISKK